MKKILTIQDISCVGKCSLTIALPVISAMGIETRILPTAVLSTHTLFPGFTFRDLTDDIPKITAHWQNQNLDFDAIYTGYLGNARQIDLIIDLIDKFHKPHNFVVIDPVMGDGGKLYPGFDQEYAQAMKRLVCCGDLVMPNLTEVGLLLDRPKIYDNYDREDIEQALKDLTALGCKKAMITGVCLNPGRIGVYYYDQAANLFEFIENEKIENHFHGTGDLFASTIVGALMRGLTLGEAIELAEYYVVACIKATIVDATHSWYGVNFEQRIPQLLTRLESYLTKKRFL